MLLAPADHFGELNITKERTVIERQGKEIARETLKPAMIFAKLAILNA